MIRLPSTKKKQGRPRTRPLPKEGKRFTPGQKYDPCRHPIDYYILASAGRTDSQIAKAFQIEEYALTEYWLKRPEMAYAKQCAVSGQNGNAREQFLVESAGHLPPSLEPIWNKILNWGEAMTFYQIKEAVKDLSKEERQCLFCMAYVHDKVNMVDTKAADMVGVGHSTVEAWKASDPQFLAMYKTLQARKGDFWESQLMNMGKAGNWAVILHVARTLLRDRGYGDKLDVSVNGTVQHEHSVKMEVILDKLSPAALEEVLGAIREAKGMKLPAGPVHELAPVAADDNEG